MKAMLEPRIAAAKIHPPRAARPVAITGVSERARESQGYFNGFFGFAQKNQTLPQMTLITLIYTDQKGSIGTIFNF
jgi:hypothetical protein